jgi:hypothetical protein
MSKYNDLRVMRFEIKEYPNITTAKNPQKKNLVKIRGEF